MKRGCAARAIWTMGTSRLALVLLVAGCAAAPAPPAEAPPDSPRERCARHLGDAAACERERGCAEGPPRTSCSGRVCIAGGPVTCVTRADLIALRGGPPPPGCE